MSENNLADIISQLSSNKDFMGMVEKIKESGDFESVLSEVSSLLGVGGAQDKESKSVSDEINVGENDSTEGAPHAQASFEKGEASEEASQDNLSSLLGGILPLFASSISSSASLLVALKPYLSKRRCELIDNIIKLSHLAGVVSLVK